MRNGKEKKRKGARHAEIRNKGLGMVTSEAPTTPRSRVCSLEERWKWNELKEGREIDEVLSEIRRWKTFEQMKQMILHTVGGSILLI